MMSLVAIDLGKRVSGYARFRRSRLVYATEVLSRPTAAAMARALVITDCGTGLPWYAEKMTDYAAKGGRSGDLEQLREIARCIEGHGVDLRLVRAHSWKGSIPKSVERSRVLAELDEEEHMAILDLGKESVSAIGIGLVLTGRLGRGLVSR